MVWRGANLVQVGRGGAQTRAVALTREEGFERTSGVEAVAHVRLAFGGGGGRTEAALRVWVWARGRGGGACAAIRR